MKNLKKSFFFIFGILFFLGFQSASAELTDDITKIHNELQEIQSKFNHKISSWTNGDITSQEFLDYSSTHKANMENLISKFNQLHIPQDFVIGVELLKSSVVTQLESDKNYIKFIETGDESYKEISNDLLQKAFLKESEGIAHYNLALEKHPHDEKSFSSTDSVLVEQDVIKDLKNKISNLEFQLQEKDRIIEEKESIIIEQIKVIQNLASKVQKTVFDSFLFFSNLI